MYDLLLRNAHIIDPSQNLDTIGTIGITDKRISFLGTAEQNESDARSRIDLDGCIACPGLIDVHTHINYLGQANGMPPDLGNIPSGVTYAVDAGSTGISNYRALLRLLEQSEIRAKIALNVSPIGLIMTTKIDEPVDPYLWDIKAFDDAMDMYGEKIFAFKIRISKNIVNELGISPLKDTIKLAERYGKKVMIHATNPPIPMGEVAELLRPGDILGHIYHGTGLDIFSNGTIDPRIYEAQKRGVYLDIACGQGNFSIDVARRAVSSGLLPDTISTDLNASNWNNPMVFSLSAMMSKMMALGMTLHDVIKCTTLNAAHLINEDGELGTLRLGTLADISVLKRIPKHVTFYDKFSNTVHGDSVLVPMMTILGGKVLYRSVETI